MALTGTTTDSTELTAPDAGDIPVVRRSRLGGKLPMELNLLAGVVLMAIVALVAIVGRVAPLTDPLAVHPARSLLSPSVSQWFGTDSFGRDIFSRVVYGMGIDLIIGLVVASLALALGAAVGVLSGYLGGWVDDVVMRVVDILMSFPSFLLALTIAVVLGNNVRNVVIAVTIAYTPYILRLTRSSVLSARRADYVLGARAVGASTVRVMGMHILPNAVGPSLVQATLMAGWAILDVSGLSFLGVGIQPPSPELGVQVAAGSKYITSGQWWPSVFPGVAIIVMVLAFNFLGDYADQRLRGGGQG